MHIRWQYLLFTCVQGGDGDYRWEYGVHMFSQYISAGARSVFV